MRVQRLLMIVRPTGIPRVDVGEQRHAIFECLDVSIVAATRAAVNDSHVMGEQFGLFFLFFFAMAMPPVFCWSFLSFDGPDCRHHTSSGDASTVESLADWAPDVCSAS